MNDIEKIRRENIKQRLDNWLPGESPIIEGIIQGKVIFFTSYGREAADLKTLGVAAKNYSQNEMAMQTNKYSK